MESLKTPAETVWALEWETHDSGECVKYYKSKAQAEEAAAGLRTKKDKHFITITPHSAHYVYGRLNPDGTSVLL